MQPSHGSPVRRVSAGPYFLRGTAKARSNRGLHPGPGDQQRALGGTLRKTSSAAEVRKRQAGFPDGRFNVLRVPICGGFRDGFSAQQGCLWVVGFAVW